MHKIKNSHLYLAPSAALFKDKACANMIGAQENKMFDVAKVYEDKIAEIEADPNAINDPAFHQTALNLKTRHLIQIQAFSSLYCKL